MSEKEKRRARYKKWYDNNREHAKKMKRERMREYRAKDPEKYAKQSREAKKRQRKKIFDLYGHKCNLCGFTDKRALTLDHIKNNGSEERRELGERGVYSRALEKYRPNEYRILCMNCQFIERHKNGKYN